MASKNKKKVKTIGLKEFLGDTKLVTVPGKNWSEIVDDEEAEEIKPIVVDIGALPTAPRGAVDIDYTAISNNPPFIAHISNLSFEADEEGLRRIFADLNPKAVRVLRDGTRSRGFGLVEFETRENLIEGLKRTDKEVYGRKIRVNVSDRTDSHQPDGGRGTFGSQRSNRSTGGEERPEMSTTWKRAEPRPDVSSDDRSSGGFNRDRQNRNDHGRSNTSGGGGGSRDNQQGNDFGFGYPRTRDDRGGGGGGGGGGGRDYNRQGQRNRQQDDENRPNSGIDRPRYGGRYSDTRDTRDRNRTNDETPTDQQEPPRERQRLQLQPRSKPLEDLQPLSGSSSSVNNVAANAEQSLISNPDESSLSLNNTTNQQIQDSSINESRDEDQQQQQQQDSNDNDQSTVKASRGAGASIFGGAKPVDTAARELEIEKKLQETQITNSETPGDNEEKSSSRPSYNRTKRSSNSDDHRERRGDGRSGHGGDYHHRQENSSRQNDDEGWKRNNDDDHPPARRGGGGGHDRDRHGGGPPRRDYDSNRTNKYNHSDKDNERGNYRNRNNDTNESSNRERPSNNNLNSESQLRYPPRGGIARRTLPTEDDTPKLQLSNKFGMLDSEDLDDNHENDDGQSPSIDG